MAETKTKKKVSGEGGKGSRGPQKVAYPVAAVDEIATPLPNQTNRARYKNLMEPLTQNPGQLFLLAEFQSTGGARRVKGQMTKGKTEVPGEVDDWEIVAIKTRVSDGDGGETDGSHLYVKYTGDNGAAATDE